MGYALRRMGLPQRVASLLWNQWQLCRGMRGNFAMESVASFAWNQWQLSYGTGGNFRAEYAHLGQYRTQQDRNTVNYGGHRAGLQEYSVIPLLYLRTCLMSLSPSQFTGN